MVPEDIPKTAFKTHSVCIYKTMCNISNKYYRKFIKNYGLISRPLTELLKKDSFKWSANAEQAFIALKKALTTAPVLALPNYFAPFVMETYTSGIGIGAALMQEGHLVAFISKGLAPRHAAFSVYERELLALVFATRKWSYYLMDSQIKWIAKLLPFDFEIQYKKGRENIAVDSLSRVQGAELMSLLVSSVSQKYFTWINHQLKRKRKVIGNDIALQTKLLTLWHSTPAGGHSGNKYDTSASPRLLQPLSIPPLPWTDITMDFIEGLPRSKAKWWYNSSPHSSIKTSPFELLYGYPPLLHLPFLPRDSESFSVEDILLYWYLIGINLGFEHNEIVILCHMDFVTD
ncbi:uncharacterized protein LOC142163116 [Nicotiana tabacum]|uniref:Uncharacterized protein LOC142163116 n=1 Tax=Nicotiana tabacum TaxID=4097 RepID=A0AC58RUS1_TOBAC